jgi:hypothetical protein
LSDGGETQNFPISQEEWCINKSVHYKVVIRDVY